MDSSIVLKAFRCRDSKVFAYQTDATVIKVRECNHVLEIWKTLLPLWRILESRGWCDGLRPSLLKSIDNCHLSLVCLSYYLSTPFSEGPEVLWTWFHEEIILGGGEFIEIIKRKPIQRKTHTKDSKKVSRRPAFCRSGIHSCLLQLAQLPSNLKYIILSHSLASLTSIQDPYSSNISISFCLPYSLSYGSRAPSTFPIRLQKILFFL